jgi:hypothetical protein
MTTTFEPFTATVWVWISGRPRCATTVTHEPGAPCGGWIVGVGLGVGLGLGLGEAGDEADDGPGDDWGDRGDSALDPDPLEQPAASAPIASAQASARARDGLLIAWDFR